MFFKSLNHYIKFIFKIDKPETQTIIPEQNCLIHYAKGKNIAVEIGVFEGANTAEIAEVLAPNGIIFGIDPFFKGRLGICYGKLIAKLHFKRKNVSNKIKLIEKLSVDAVDEIQNDVELFFVDGDHSYEGLEKDWNIVKTKLKVGGIACLHDTTIPEEEPHRNHGSVKFYKEVISKDNQFELLENIYSMNILRKKY